MSSYHFGFGHPEPILREVFTDWQTGAGLFSYLDQTAELPWAEDENIDITSLDIAYFGNHSGGKFCSPLVKHLLNDNEDLSSAARQSIAKILISKYLPNWQHLWNTNIVSYNPIHNYDMTENRTLHRADSSSEDESRTDSTDASSTAESNEMDYAFGLNTQPDAPKPSDQIDTTDGTISETSSTGTTQRNRVGADEEEEVLTRSGNIGVTTTQQMLTSERDLWRWNYFDQVFADLDRELALMFHDVCRV